MNSDLLDNEPYDSNIPYNRALDAIRRLFSDTGVGPETTAEALERLRDEIEDMLTAVREDIDLEDDPAAGSLALTWISF